MKWAVDNGETAQIMAKLLQGMGYKTENDNGLILINLHFRREAEKDEAKMENG
ncbi:hypothetical protein [Paenibacillus baekrokdamisoli]|uniref:hypothetical protein n=1 Tax=Paenibacillus baekrokdamisoli TaxID=1712516 RepID=UPI001E5BE674|nr:hypothetical protein [Paenibacillus baekrokdamisoli]